MISVAEIRAYLWEQPRPIRAKSYHFADHMGVSLWSLRHYLKIQRANWDDIKAQVVSDRAEEMLRTMAPKEVSAQLGFGEVSAFYRAYKSWHGRSFTEDRAR